MIFDISTPNGRRLSLENWLKSVISLISLSVISLKSGDFMKISQFFRNDFFDTMNGKAPLKSDWYEASYLLKMLIFMEICSFKSSLKSLISKNLHNFIEICWQAIG